MKQIIAAALVFFTFDAKGQECEVFSPMEEGKILEYTDYNKNGKPQSKSIHEVIRVTNHENQPEAEIKATLIEKKKEALNTTYKVKCKEGAFYIDMVRFFDQGKLAEQQDFELEIDGDFLKFPKLMQTGDQLEDGSINIKVNNNGGTLVTLTMDIINRKVSGKEKLTTPAGTFECYKISFDFESKFGIINFRGKGVEWLAEGIGIVKSESYNKKGKLRAYHELTAVK